jgi:hypothetical protein
MTSEFARDRLDLMRTRCSPMSANLDGDVWNPHCARMRLRGSRERIAQSEHKRLVEDLTSWQVEDPSKPRKRWLRFVCFSGHSGVSAAYLMGSARKSALTIV